MIVEIELPFDAVDALVHECLAGNYIGIQEPRGGVKFEWEQMAGWRSACRITDKEPGDLGCVRIYGKDARLTAIQIDGPEPVKSRLPLPREKEPIVAIEDRDDRRAAWATLFMQLSKEADEIHNRRRKLHGTIIKRFWSRFNDEVTAELGAKSKTAAPRRGRPPQGAERYMPKTPEKLDEYRRAWQVIRRKNEEYYALHEAGEVRGTKPKDSDLRDAIYEEEELIVSERTIRTIKMLGRKELLD